MSKTTRTFVSIRTHNVDTIKVRLGGGPEQIQPVAALSGSVDPFGVKHVRHTWIDALVCAFCSLSQRISGSLPF